MKKWIMSILTVFALSLLLPGSAFAAARELSVYLYRDYADCVFFVNWQNTEQSANISIKSPDGEETQATTQNTGFGRGSAAINIGTAASGHWTIFVDGENLGAISVSGGSSTTSTQQNAIQSFSAEVNNGYVNFAWSAEAEQDAINVSVSATQGSEYGNRAVFSDYSASKNGTASIPADDLPTGLYTFSIQVYDGSAQHTFSTDTPVFVKQPNAPDKLENVRAGSIDGEMFITWNTRMNAGYQVTLYDYETLAVMKSEYTNSSFYPISLPAGINRIKISAAATDGNVYGDFDVYEIVSSSPAGMVTFPDYSATRENSVPVQIDCPADITAGVYLDGMLIMENAAAGSYDLYLSEGVHDVTAYVKDKNGNMRTFSKQITVDKTPPVVSLNCGSEVKTASDRLVITGNTEPNAVVAVNGVEQDLGAGSFMAKIALKNGVNPISISAYDTAGNKSVKTITAKRDGILDTSWTVFILPGIAFALLSVWYGYLGQKSREVKIDEKAD